MVRLNSNLGVPVACRNCGHRDQIACKAIRLAPTPEIVRTVCGRDACPNCGEVAMQPVEEEVLTEGNRGE